MKLLASTIILTAVFVLIIPARHRSELGPWDLAAFAFYAWVIAWALS